MRGAGVGRGLQPFVCGCITERLPERSPFVFPCAALVLAGGGTPLVRMLGACSSPPPPAHPLLPRWEPC